ncbi:hypothetical protein M426DRAFT_324414 [Hypoxylon sp. CI-4A]|nr:hypothetical protein M426DRAFT_324414 [Hypoxylon sp. CI-4A]
MEANTRLKDSKSGRGSAPDYITVRRERGKLAQRAFRQRQIDTIRSLEAETQKLRDAISAISDAASQNDSVLSQAISDARKVAGLSAKSLEVQSMAKAFASPEESMWSDSLLFDDALDTTAVSSEDYDMFGFMVPSFDAREQADNWSLSLPYRASEACVLPSNYDACDSGIDMPMPASGVTAKHWEHMKNSTVSVEPDTALHIANPPPDIMPYIGSGAYTLAGQMYWAAMAFGFQAARAVVSSKEPPPAAVSIVADLFTHTMKQMALPKIMFLMHARLAFRRYGSFNLASEEHWEEIKYFLDPAILPKITAALGKEFHRAGIRKEDYLTPLDIERRLRDRFQDEYPVFEAALKGQAIVQEHVVIMRRLMQIMSRQSICFGDGPRWRAESVNTLAEGWELSTKQIAINGSM